MAGLPSARTSIVIVAAAGVAVILFAGQSAGADLPVQIAPQLCLPHGEIEARLLRNFSEKKLGLGIAGDGRLLEIFIAPTGTFTIVKTSPRGLSCVVDFGEGWRTLDQLEAAGLTADDPPAAPF